MARLLSLRFDVDSHRCLGTGTRALTEVADHHGVRLTFYVHLGRATHRGSVLRDLVRPRPRQPDVHRLSSRRKLGTAGTARLLLTNPRVGDGGQDELRRLDREGHEIGLHGGRNHRTWQDGAPAWGENRLAAEIAWGMHRLAQAGIASPRGFASPAWATSPAVARQVRAAGFAYLADRHDPHGEGVVRQAGAVEVVTNLVGEPGGVGYLEWARAQGWGDGDVVDDFTRRLRGIRELAILYDHPFWAGLHDAELLDALLGRARSEGLEIVTVGQAVDRLTAR